MLPNLPKKNKKKEASFGLVFRKWFEQHSTEFTSTSFELKDTDGADSLPFEEVKSLQINSALRSQSDKGNLIRAIVATSGTGDYLFLRNVPNTHVCIRFPTMWCIIRVNDFIKEKDISKRKSLTENRARQIAEIFIDLTSKT